MEQNETTVPLEPGMTVACYVPDYDDEEPQIGAILSITNETEEVLIEWMTGTYSEPWSICKKKGKDGYSTWKELIPLSMVLFPIELSASRRIHTTLKKKLQDAYAQIRGD